MKNNKFFFGIGILLTIFGCAQFVPPTGGKKDEIPPKLLNTIPKNKATNFKGKEVELYFDE